MDRRRWLLVVVLVLVVAPMAPHGRGASQDPAAGPAPARVVPRAIQERRVIVDGSTQPELIPDAQVMRLLMTLWAIPPDADAARERRLRLQTSRLGLSEADFALLRMELGHAYLAMTAARAQLHEARGAIAARAAHADLRTVSAGVFHRILERLSADGREQLRAHVAYTKTRITVSSVHLE